MAHNGHKSSYAPQTRRTRGPASITYQCSAREEPLALAGTADALRAGARAQRATHRPTGTKGGEASALSAPASGSAGGAAPGSGSSQRRFAPQSASFRHPAPKKFVSVAFGSGSPSDGDGTDAGVSPCVGPGAGGEPLAALEPLLAGSAPLPPGTSVTVVEVRGATAVVIWGA